jgi:26S proteasome non-ATPase regulatory subunit 9
MDSSPSFQRLHLLMAQRDALEAEAEAVRSELEAPGPEGQPPPGLRGPLVDAEGFPRADIDLYNVRTKRNRLACINTDYRALMLEIEVELKHLHASSVAPASPLTATSGLSSSTSSKLAAVIGSSRAASCTEGAASDQSELSAFANALGFALVDEVAESSPAASAGLRVGDVVVFFGGLKWQASGLGLGSSPMTSIPRVVQESVNRPVRVVVWRGPTGAASGRAPAGTAAPAGQTDANIDTDGARDRDGAAGGLVEVSLVPRVWSGRGLLGCHLSPTQTSLSLL